MTSRSLAAAAILVVATIATTRTAPPSDPRAGLVLVANQQSASASLIDLKDDSARVIAVGTGPHEAVFAPSGRIAVVTIYGVGGAPRNQLAVVDPIKGVVTGTARKVSWMLDQLGSPRGVNIAPDAKTAFVTLAADETMGVVDLEARKLTRKIKVEKSPDGVWFGAPPR